MKIKPEPDNAVDSKANVNWMRLGYTIIQEALDELQKALAAKK